jgi:hypothetical protein
MKYPVYAKHNRTTAVTLNTGFYITPFKFKSYSLLISSSGQVYYTPSTYSHNLFQVSKSNQLTLNSNLYKKYNYLTNIVKLPQQIQCLIVQLVRFKLISSIEIYPTKGSQYVHSPGSKSFLTKLDLKTNTSLIKLPSGVHKMFSIYSTTSLNQIPFNDKNLKTRANAGFFKKFGIKSLSRGVAKNPVDHPHGGRNKAIKYQRTP